MTESSPRRDPALLTARSALVFLLATLAGACAAMLAIAGDASLPNALLTAAGAANGAAILFNRIIAAKPDDQ